MRTLSPDFLHKLAIRLDDENTLGMLLEGSLARGENGLFSDIDLWQYVRQEPLGEADRFHVELINGNLVTVKLITLESEYASLKNPRRAIWTIPALRQARILLDKDGLIACLQDTAVRASWAPLQKAADAFASYSLAGTCEEVQKILDGLASSDESKTTYAIWSVTQNLSEAVLVQRGVLVPSENAYIDLAQAAAGRESGWTRQFRLALRLDPSPPGTPAFVGFGTAGLRLYRETAVLFKDILQPVDAPMVDRALEMIAEAGY